MKPIMSRMLCPGCGKDTCKQSDGLCYSCRQKQAEEKFDVNDFVGANLPATSVPRCANCGSASTELTDGLCLRCAEREKAGDRYFGSKQGKTTKLYSRPLAAPVSEEKKPGFPCRNRVSWGKCYRSGGLTECSRTGPCENAEPPWGRDAEKIMTCSNHSTPRSPHSGEHIESKLCKVAPVCVWVAWREVEKK